MKEDEKMSRLIRSKKSGAKKALVFFIIILILLLAGAFAIIKASSNNDKIYKGVKISNLNMSIEDMSVDEAIDALQSFQTLINDRDYIIEYNGNTISFKGSEVDFKISKNIVGEAHLVGRDSIISQLGANIKGFFGQELASLEADITLDEEALKTKILDLVDEYGTSPIEVDPVFSGDYIYITKGRDGIEPNYAKAKEDLIAVAGGLQEDGKIVLDATIKTALKINFDDLYKKVYVEKRDASYEEGGKYVQEKVGVSFNKTAAQSQYDYLKPGEEMKIKLIKDEPEITTANLNEKLFKDKLGTHKTTYNASNTNRSTNLSLAANSINGIILLPGEEFSYNEALGERTAARGYKEAHVYSGGEVVDGLGGGICQISSTLYNAVLKADLEVTNRKGHMFWPEYVDPSFDATVVWGSIDFNFKNNRETPVKIEASAKSGVALVTIYGLKKEDEPTVKLEPKIIQKVPYNTKTVNDPTLEEGKQVVSQQPVVGYVSEGYKVYLDSKGVEINRVQISKDSYQPTNKIIKIGTKKVNTTAPVVTPVENPTPVEPEQPVETPPEVTTPEEPNNNGNNNSQGNTGSNNQWPTGWDTPENPNYKG